MKPKRIESVPGGPIHRQTRDIRCLTIFSFIMFFILFLFGCGGGEQSKRPLSASGKTNRDDLNIIECKGTIEAEHHFSRYLQQEEKIVSFTVRDGADVKKGDLLVVLSNYVMLKEFAQLSYRKIDHNEKKHNLEILNLKIARTDRELSNLQKELEEEDQIAKRINDYPLEIQTRRIKKDIERLQDERTMRLSKKDFLKKSIKKEEQIILFLENQLTEVNSRLMGMEIRAPFDGVVVFVASSGESLHPGDLIIEVLDDSKLYVRALAWQHQLQYIESGSEVKIYPDFFSDYFFKGNVRKISSSYIKGPKDEYPKFSIYIDIEPGLRKIRVGMSVTIKIKSSG